MIGSYVGYRTLSYYRLERVRNMEVTDKPIIPMENILGSNADLKLKEFVNQNIYNYSGKLVRLKLPVDRDMVDLLLDTFGGEQIREKYRT